MRTAGLNTGQLIARPPGAKGQDTEFWFEELDSDKFRCPAYYNINHVTPGQRLMSQPGRKPLFTVSNHHVSGEEPPQIDGDAPNTYHSYFENRYGEQSLFVCRHDTKEAKVYSGDAGWAAFSVVDGEVSGLILAPEEAVWFSACLMASGLG